MTGDGKKLAAAGLIGLVIGGAGVAIASRGPDLVAGDRAKVERIVREYVLANPEIIPQAMEALQNRRMSEAVGENRAAFETPFGSAWTGAKDGDVVLVEFFDYACGYCRKSNADIDRLLAEDKQLKVVWRELPVLGPDSQAAAEISLAAAKQGRFTEFYHRLFAAGRPTPATVATVRQELGIVPAPRSPEFQAEIDRNYQLARSIGASGTPTFVVGGKVLQGAVGYAALKEAIAEARTKG